MDLAILPPSSLHMLSIRVLVSCVIRVGMVIVARADPGVLDHQLRAEISPIFSQYFS